MLSKTIEKFNEQIDNSPTLQTKLKSINSPLDLINIAKQEGFEITLEDFKALAQQAYQKWIESIDSPSRIFFEKVHLSPELNQELHKCYSMDDVINLSRKCDCEITLSNLQLAADMAKSIKGFSFEKLFFHNLGMFDEV